MKVKSLILILMIVLMEFSTVGLMTMGESKVLEELSKIHVPRISTNGLDPRFKEFRNGTPVTVWEEQIISKVTISPLSGTLDIGEGIKLSSDIEKNWVTGLNATGYLSENLEEIYENSTNNINDTGVLVLAFLVTDVKALNESLFCDERVRIVVDEILRFAEEVGDASIVLAGNCCTAMNLMYLLRLAELDRRVGEVYLIVLTHGVLNETLHVHGMLMHGKNSVAVVNGETLRYLADTLRVKRLGKLRFVYLPFCNMGKERKIYNNSSVVWFFEKFSDAAILTYDGEAYLNGEYICSVQSVLSSGVYELIEEHVYLPVKVIDNFTGETVDGYVEFRVMDEIKELNSTVNPYEIYDDENNVTLGFRLGRRTSSRGVYKVTVHRKNVRAVIYRGIPPKSYTRKKFKRIIYGIPPRCKTFGKARKISKICFKHKTRSIPVIAGRFWRPPKAERKYFGNSFDGRLRASIDEVKKAVLLVDEIFDAIYKNYYGIKSAIYRWIDKTFNAPWSKWMRNPVKSALDKSVFRGANFLIKFAKQYLKTITCIAYHLKNAGKSLGELVAALIIAAIAKFAKGILKYFSWTLDKLLKTLSNVLGTDLSWVKKILDGWIDPTVKFLDNAVAYSEATFKSAARKFAETIIKPFNWIWNQIKSLFDTLWSSFVDFSIDNYLTLAYLLSELVVEGKLSEKFVKSIMNIAGKILDFILSLQPTEKKLHSWLKIYNVWLTAAIIAGKMRIKTPESWKTIASRDAEKSNKIANGRVEDLYKILYDILESKVKHTNLLRMDDIMIVFREGLSDMKWRDAQFPGEMIGKIEKIVLNKELSKRLEEGIKLIEYDKNGKIKKIILDYKGGKSRRFYYWFGEVNIIQVAHTHIDGKPVAFVIVWEGHLNWFTDPDENKNLRNAKEKHFEGKIKNGILYGKDGDPRALMSKFIPCKVETEDFTLKGYRIVLGLKIKVTPSPEGLNVDTPGKQFNENYGKLIPTELVWKLIKSNPELKREFEEKKCVEFFYRFDGGLKLEDGTLGKNWISKTEKIKQLMKMQADFWNKYVNKYKTEKGKMPSFFDTIAQSIFEIHPIAINDNVEMVIKLCDPPFLNEVALAHTELTLVLEKTIERLEIENLNEQKNSAEKTKLQVESYIKENFGDFYEKIHKELLPAIKGKEKEYRKNLETAKTSEEIRDITKSFKEAVNERSKEILDDSGSWDYELLDNLRKENAELRSEVRKNIYEKGLAKLDENIGETFIELPTKPPESGVIQNLKHVEKTLKSEKVKSVYKKILGKACNMGTSITFIVIFVTASFLGTKFGMEIYSILSNKIKSTLKSGSGKFKVYMLLACVSYALVNVDDYQDFAKFIKRVKDEGTLKDITKVLLQTFLGCLLNGILIGMLMEDNNIILADEIIPYIAETIFGKNAWIFEKIMWPIIDTTIQVFGNGGPIMYLTGTAIGTIVTQILQKTIN